MTGGADKRMYLYYQLADSIKKADSVDIIVSFLMESGVKMLLGELDDALKRGAKIRILTGNYLGITQPSALYLIKHKLGEQVDLRFYNEKNRSFHPKSYMFHYKDYEPTFEHYGLPPYIAGMNVSAIAYKTDKWNISRLDNSFQLSGIMVLDGNVDNEQDAYEIIRAAEKRFAGQPGQVMFMVKNAEEADNSKFVPISSSNEGDWKSLHDQAVTDIVVAHSWFRSLSGLDYLSGFDSERILHEYEIALNTLILGEQQELLEPIRIVIGQVLGSDTSSMQIVNRPPARSKPLYMKVWEARKADGLDYDPDDPTQNLYVAQITKYAMRNID